MKNVLSVQSSVVYGYAGNKAAVLPMQLSGIDVWPFYTVQFSNHTQSTGCGRAWRCRTAS